MEFSGCSQLRRLRRGNSIFLSSDCSIRGSFEDGKNGRNGTDGLDGKDGADGKDGVDGKNGRNGTDGLDGKDGADGKGGMDGAPGPARRNGTTWSWTGIFTNFTNPVPLPGKKNFPK